MVLYIYLQSKIGEPSFLDGNVMPVSEVCWRMAQWKIPNNLKPIIIKIWEDMKLIEKIDKRNIRFKKTNFDIMDLREINKELEIDIENCKKTLTK